MDGRIETTRWLRIDNQVLGWDGVLFVPEVANKTGVCTYTIQEALDGNMIDFDALYTRKLNWKDPVQYARRVAAEKVEILIPATIPPALIKFP
jgi:hypothetical protein